MACYQNIEQNLYLELVRPLILCQYPRTSERTTATNRNEIPEEIKRRFNSGSACYYPYQNLLSTHTPYKNIRLKFTK
jgi:hypothetical protein